MSHIHKRFSDEQVKVLFQGYDQGQFSRADLQELLGIGKSRFFALLKAYRQDPKDLASPIGERRQLGWRRPWRQSSSAHYCGRRKL